MSKKSAKENIDTVRNSVSAFVDRIENGLAVIVLSEASEIHFDFPLQFLPTHLREGDHLTLTFEVDPETTVAVRDRVAALQAELTKENESETEIKL
ncbi:MAG: DUF3006 domain-containing protein [Acidobacteria bacterium]|nr:DUF3006 domain-containing protein [Acidobacteriota bacterium]